MRLRSYLYRDDQRIDEFLQQLQAGLVGEATITSEAVQSMDGKADAKVIGVEAGQETTQSRSFTIEPTPVSRAQQLENMISEDVVDLSNIEPDALAEVRHGEVVSFAGTLHVPELVRKTITMAALGEILVDHGTALGQDRDFSETLEPVQALNRLLEIDGFPVTASGRDTSPAILFVAQMRLIIGDAMEMDGAEVTVLGRLKQNVANGKAVGQNELLPNLSSRIPTPNREQRRGSKNPAAKPVTITGPGAIVDPFMIYD